MNIPKFFRGDAAFANPALYRLLENEDYRYAIRIKSNAVLEREIEHLLTRPVGRPSHKPKVFYHSFQYQAKSWQHSRRVVAKVEWHAGELFPRVGFIVTNLTKHSKNVVKFYNGRGTAEQWIKEGKNAVKWTKLSCRTFKDNQTRLQLFALAYNLANFLRRLALPQDMDDVGAPCEADQEVTIEGYFFQYEKVSIHFTTVLGEFIVNEANDAKANDESLGEFIAPHDPGLAKLGVLIHVIGDRYSHNLCSDKFFIWENEETGGYDSEWDPDGCAQGLHFLAHVWEVGTDQSKLTDITHRTMQSTIEADFDLLSRYASEIHGITSPDESVSKTEVVSEIMTVLESNKPIERLNAMVTLMEEKGVLPLPEHGAYLGQALSIEDWLINAAVPEPSSSLLALSGILGLLGLHRRRN